MMQISNAFSNGAARLILGGNVFGWTIDAETSFSVLDAFVDGGGRVIDTADVYSAWVDVNKGGESETIIGQWLKRRGRRDDVVITTKVGLLEIDGRKGLSASHVTAAIDASLRRLQTDYVDLYLVHRDDESVSQDEVAETFGALVKTGKVRTIGASNFDLDRLQSALAAQSALGAAHYQVLQNQYNLLERKEFEGDLQKFVVHNGILMTPYYSLASGYLSGKYRSEADLAGKPRGNAARKYMEGQGPSVLEAVDRVSAELNASPVQVALAWLNARPGVVAPIASATSVSQVGELLRGARITLTSEQVRLLDTASSPKTELTK